MKTARPVSAAVWAGGRSLGDPRLSPDGRQISFVTSSADRAELAIRDVDGGPETWLPLEPGIKRTSHSGGGVYDWLPDSSGVVYIGADGLIHRFTFDGYATHALTRIDEQVSTVAVSPDGRSVAYVMDLQHVAVASTDAGGEWPRRISSGADFVFDPTWSPDGAHVAWHEWDMPNMPWDGGRIVVRRADASSPVVTVAGGDDVSVQQPRFSPDGTHLAFLSDGNGWLNLWVADAPSFDNARPVLREEFEHGDPAWGPGQRSYCWTSNDSFVVTRNENGRGRLVACTLNGEVREVSSGMYTGLAAARSTVVGCVTDVARGLELEVRTPDATQIVARGSLAGIERAAVEPEDVTWTSTDGATIHGRLYRTDGSSGPSPMIVWVTGGPTAQSRATLFARCAYFVERGWSVLVADYRGTTGWGREYQQALRGQWGKSDVDDVASGIRAAVERGWADPERIVPVGGSAGGCTVLLLMALHPEMSTAGVVMYPVTDLVGLAEDTWRFEAHYSDTLVGPLPDAYTEYVSRSPKTVADRIRRPLLMLHGDSDVVVPLAQSQEFVASVGRNGGVVDLHIYDGEGHGWRKSSTRIDELERIHAFLRRHVLHIGPETEEKS